jgi:hypothetical protein
MPDASPASPVYDFAMICTEAIFLERTARMTRGETLKKSDVVRIIREQDALRLDRPTVKARSKPSKADSSQFGNRRAIPPSPEQVTAYSASIGYPLDGQAWCDSYEVKGWAVGKVRMKDWQCAVRNWKTNGYGQNGIALGPVKLAEGRNYDRI